MGDIDNTERGTWVVLEVGYVNPRRTHCAFCGRPLARKVWRENIDGQELLFCDPEHVDLYRSYWLPLYGTASATTS